MAEKKQARMPASTKKIAVRLELATADWTRLNAEAKKLDRSLSYCARIAVLSWISARETE